MYSLGSRNQYLTFVLFLYTVKIHKNDVLGLLNNASKLFGDRATPGDINQGYGGNSPSEFVAGEANAPSDFFDL